MKNRQYEEFAKEKFDKEKNYNAIISKIKEGSPMKKNKSTKYKIKICIFRTENTGNFSKIGTEKLA